MAKTTNGRSGFVSFQLFGITIHINLSWAFVALFVATSLLGGAFIILFYSPFLIRDRLVRDRNSSS